MKKYFDAKMCWILAGLVLTGGLMLNLNLRNTLDTHLFYSADFFIEFFNRLDADLRGRYLQQESLDLLFMLLYTVFFYLHLSWLFGRRAVRWLALLPVVFDFTETVLIILCLTGRVDPATVSWLGVATFLKWLAVFLVLAVSVPGLIARVRAARLQ